MAFFSQLKVISLIYFIWNLYFFAVFSVDDLKANAEYIGYSAASPVIQWFWEVVKGFSKEEMARLLQFVTGTSKVKKILHSTIHDFVICLKGGDGKITAF